MAVLGTARGGSERDPFVRFTFKSRENQLILDTLTKEVKAQNPSFSLQNIKGIVVF